MNNLLSDSETVKRKSITKPPGKSSTDSRPPDYNREDSGDEKIDTPSAGLDLQTPQIYLFVGIPRSGKSYLIQSLMNHWKSRFKEIRVYSGSIGNDDYEDVKPENVLEYDPEDLDMWRESLLETRKLLKKQNKEMWENLIIFDDCLGSLNNDKIFKKLASTFRHTKTTIFLASQYLASGLSSTNVRSFAEYIFLFDAPNESVLAMYYDYWGGRHWKNKEEFGDAIEEVVKNKYTAFLIVRSQMRDEPYYSYKAD